MNDEHDTHGTAAHSMAPARSGTLAVRSVSPCRRSPIVSLTLRGGTSPAGQERLVSLLEAARPLEPAR